jgi:hypothetical protein
MTVQDHIRELEQRHGTEVYARVPFGENGTWGVNVQFHRAKDGAFLEVQPVRSFDWTAQDRGIAGIIRRRSLPEPSDSLAWNMCRAIADLVEKQKEQEAVNLLRGWFVMAAKP